MKIVTIDFETTDPYIEAKKGAGWVFKSVYGDRSDFKVISCGVRTHEGKYIYITKDWKALEKILADHDTILGHNLSYDLGCADSLGIDVSSYNLLDTKIISKLYRSDLDSYSLDFLSSSLTNTQKDLGSLGDAAWAAGLYPWLKREEDEKRRAEKAGIDYVRTKPDTKKLNKFAIKNIELLHDKIPKDVMKYCLTDVKATWDLFVKLSSEVDMDQALHFSGVIHMLNDMRKRGILIDINEAVKARNRLNRHLRRYKDFLFSVAGKEFNIHSNPETVQVLKDYGIKLPKTTSGNLSATSVWLNKRKEPICRALAACRTLEKCKRDYIEKFLEMGEHVDDDHVRLHPELGVLDTKTGRTNCSNPNLQQIPARHPIAGKLCRGMFVANPGEKLYSADWSNQEGRLAIHFATKVGCRGAKEFAEAYKENPKMDAHQKLADIVGMSRTEAKTLGLGILYFLGIKTLATNLNCSEEHALELKTKTIEQAPFNRQLGEACMSVMKSRGYIKTWSGRKLHVDAPSNGRTYEYKGSNKLIQGSALDMGVHVLLQAWQLKLPVSLFIHDQIILSGTKEQALKLKEIMEDFPFEVPMVVDMNEEGGHSWTEAGH